MEARDAAGQQGQKLPLPHSHAGALGLAVAQMGSHASGVPTSKRAKPQAGVARSLRARGAAGRFERPMGKVA